MSVVTTKIWTSSIVASTLIIDETFGFQEVSLVMVAGNGTVRGSLSTPNGIPSSPIPLTINQALTINTGSSSGLISYLEITTTGTVLLIAR